MIADRCQRSEEVVESHIAVAGRHEIPSAPVVSELQVRAEDRAPAIQTALRVLYVNVVDPVGELAGERGRIEQLVF